MLCIIGILFHVIKQKTTVFWPRSRFVSLLPLESTYSVQAYGIHADFSLGARVFMEIEEALAGYEIGILGTEIRCHEFASVSLSVW